MSTDQSIQERQAIENYCRIIESRLGWGDSAQWRDQDFESLSQKIFEATGVSLSVTTLKRIFGKLKYEGIPNASTLNALAVFAGYGSWLEFKTQTQTQIQTQEQIHAKNYTQLPGRILKQSVVYLVLLVVIAGIVLSFVLKRNGHVSEAEMSTIVFGSEPVAKGIPNTVIFHFDIGDMVPQRMEIQQSWDSTKRFTVTPDMTMAASTYYYPGYFRAKLLIEGQIAKEHDLLIPSDGWLATLNSEPQPRYFLHDELSRDGTLAVAENFLVSAQEQAGATQTVGFHYVRDFGTLSADEFTFQATFQNTYAKGDAICQVTRIVILGTEGFVIIPFSIPGCTGDLRLVVHNEIIDGKTNDLSTFGCDFSAPQQLTFETHDHMAEISLNDKVIYALKYEDPIGRLAGFRFLFTGSGIVDDVRIIDNTGNVLFEELF